MIRPGHIENEFGYCAYAFEEDYVHVYNLFIFPEFRRQGKARDILRQAIEAIKKTGYEGLIQIVAEPQPDCISKEKLMSFYKSLGLTVFEYYG